MVVENFAFETQSNTCYDGDINLGRAVVFMNQNHHVAKIDFIYMVDKNDNWSFYYEKGTCLTDEERTELENWFITYGWINEDFGVEYEVRYRLPNGIIETMVTEWLWEKRWNCIYPVIQWREYNPIIVFPG